MKGNSEVMHGLPEKVVFCKRCVMSNQRPSSSVEFRHTTNKKHKTLHIDQEGICDACRVAEQKERIDWKKREDELLKLVDKHRRDDGHYDCIVPGERSVDIDNEIDFKIAEFLIRSQ